MKRCFYLFFIIVISQLYSCAEQKGNFNSNEIDFSENPYFFLDSVSVISNPKLFGLYQMGIQYSNPELTINKEINTGWRFRKGDPKNGLQTQYSPTAISDTIVNLPHRINSPNWPFWYEQKLPINEATILYANGDDGVQCYLNGEIQEAIYGDYFFIPASSDFSTITIRVLNNALKGGLRKAAFTTPKDFQVYLEKRKLAQLSQYLIFIAHQHGDNMKPSDWEFFTEAMKSADTMAMKNLIKKYEALKLPQIKRVEKMDNKYSSFSFSAWGDSQGGWNTFSKLIRHMASTPDDFSIGLGDLVAHGIDENQWYSFTQCLQPLLKKQFIFPIVGNHDYDGYYNDLNPLLYKEFVLSEANENTYLSWTYQGAFFLALDPNETFPLGINGKQKEWIMEEINSAKWKDADWRFILIHQPPYSQGWPEYHGDDFIRELVDSLAESKKIDFVLSGHSHDYERLSKNYGTQQTHFFVLGGAGGGLEPPESSDFPVMDTIIKEHHYARFEVRKEQVEVFIHGLENQILDKINVTKSPLY